MNPSASAPRPGPTAPHTYPRRVLLTVTGFSPQIVTETLYALCVCQDPPFVPTEIRLVTTSAGAKDAELSLLSDDPGWFHALRRDYDLPEMRFTPEDIDQLRDGDGNPLPDIRDRAENDRAADQIVDLVRELTGDPDAALHVSIAGGRKTMGYYLGYALSLFGRPQDRLSHVLVSPAYESNRGFYYPTPGSRVIYTTGASSQQQHPIDAKDAQVTLADIPFVRLRNHLPGHLKVLKNEHVRFSEVVAATQQALTAPGVVVDYPNGVLCTADGQEVRMPPADLAFYGWMARRTRAGSEPMVLPPEEWPEPAYLDGYLAEYRLAGARPGTEKNLKSAGGLPRDFLEQRKTAVKKALEEQLGPHASRYDLKPQRPGKPIPWVLDIDPDAIRFVEE